MSCAEIGECAVCGHVGTVDKHHLIPRSAGGSDDSWNIIPLCETHHKDVHSPESLFHNPEYVSSLYGASPGTKIVILKALVIVAEMQFRLRESDNKTERS